MGHGQKFWKLESLLTAGILSLSLLPSAHAQMTEIKLPTAIPKVTSPKLAKLKKLENEGKFAECARLAPSVFESHSSIRGWILRTWMKCALSADRADKKMALLPAALRAYDNNAALKLGMWADETKTQSVQGKVWLLESFMKGNAKLGDQYLGTLMMDLGPRDVDLSARAWALLGDQAQVRHDLAGAETALVQSLKFSDSTVTQEKLRTVRLALNRPEAPKPVVNATTEEAPSEVEVRFANRFKASKDKNDPLLRLEDLLAYLKELPNGSKSKWAAQSCLEIHQTLLSRVFESSNKDRWRLVLDRAIGQMKEADPERLVEWVPIIYRRGDYSGAFRLSEEIVSEFAKTASGDNVLWYAARSAQLTGNYKKADKYFTQFFERHGGSELSHDADFQWAMTLIRLGDFASSVARFEKLLRSSAADKFELSARYWMIRALQAQKSPRGEEEIKIVTQKFPASYYGIRLKAESSNNEFAWPFTNDKLKSLKSSIYLSPRQKVAWDRLVVLRAHAWTNEALMETDDLPLPDDPVLKVLWAQELARAEAYPKVIRLLNEVSELAPEMRSLDVLSLGLPINYKTEISDEAKKQKLSPILVRSLIRQESAFNPRAVSRSNALGLMQLIPPTAKEVADALKISPLDLPEDAFRVGTNIQMGSAYLARMIRNFSGSVPLGLAAYNAGPRRMEAFLDARRDMREQLKTASSDPLTEVWFDEMPWAETSFYVKAILRNTLLYKTLEQKKITLSGVLWADLVDPK